MKSFTLGADPEFLCCNPSGVISNAGDFFNRGSHTGIDHFGLDGCGRIFELRPDPFEEPLEVVCHIKDILATHSFGKPSLVKQTWKSGSYHNGHALGGHIHFGYKPLNTHPESYCKTLSLYLGAILILVEKKDEALNRRHTGYGGFIDFRQQTHGLEYRTPSSWLTSPFIAAATLCLAKVVGDEIINHSLKYKNGIIGDTWIREVNKVELRKAFPKIWADIEKMNLYGKYAEYINLFKFLIENKLTWYPKHSMKEAWGIVDKNKIMTQKTTIESIWEGVA
jgi:hypothetical protein